MPNAKIFRKKGGNMPPLNISMQLTEKKKSGSAGRVLPAVGVDGPGKGGGRKGAAQANQLRVYPSVNSIRRRGRKGPPAEDVLSASKTSYFPQEKRKKKNRDAFFYFS